MHFKVRGVGRGDFEAMQDIAVTPEVRYLGIFFSLTKNPPTGGERPPCFQDWYRSSLEAIQVL